MGNCCSEPYTFTKKHQINLNGQWIKLKGVFEPNVVYKFIDKVKIGKQYDNSNYPIKMTIKTINIVNERIYKESTNVYDLSSKRFVEVFNTLNIDIFDKRIELIDITFRMLCELKVLKEVIDNGITKYVYYDNACPIKPDYEVFNDSVPPDYEEASAPPK